MESSNESKQVAQLRVLWCRRHLEHTVELLEKASAALAPLTNVSGARREVEGLKRETSKALTRTKAMSLDSVDLNREPTSWERALIKK